MALGVYGNADIVTMVNATRLPVCVCKAVPPVSKVNSAKKVRLY